MKTFIDASPKTALRLPRALRAQLSAWAHAGYPRESCGLLIGSQQGALIDVVRLRLAHNLDTARARDRYELDPADHLAADAEARSLGLDVVGVWHSHPDHPARPSETDRERAWSGWSYVIVSVAREGMRNVRSWRLCDGKFREEKVLP
jgi:proteasome lid subunit RPN8/RPN11